MGKCLFKRFICFKNFYEFFIYLFRWRKEGGGCTNACICIGTHSQPLLQNHLMDFDETCYGWSAQGPLHVSRHFGQIRQGADPGRGQYRSRGFPFFKKLLHQTGMLQQQTESKSMILKHLKRSVVIFGSVPKSNFWHVFVVSLDLAILPYFNAISIDFYAVMCIINIYFV